MPERFTMKVGGRAVEVEPGTTVAAAVVQSGWFRFRKSVTGSGRGPLCAMGVCFECRLTINGVPHRLSCQTRCQPGMEVEPDVC